jgi:hypothetical protein
MVLRWEITAAAETAGVYTIRLTITDKDGGFGESIYEFVVVYNPDSGFVTGAGWFESELGWCLLNELCAAAEGKARFGDITPNGGYYKFQIWAGDETGSGVEDLREFIITGRKV